MTYGEALEYLSSVGMLGGRPGLERMAVLLEDLGHPERDLLFLHVAGTNGKGSTAALLSSCLRQAGYRVGLFTSPHLVRYNERFRINGTPLSDEALARALSRVRPAAERLPETPTQFELLTCAALVAFREAGCEAAVLEVGLGGRLDATNAIPTSEVSVITRIGLDHTELLGDTLEKISWEKAGIVKPGGQVVLGDHTPSVVRVVEEVCRERGAALRLASPALPLERSLEGQFFRWGAYDRLPLSLLGAHQLQNAATALTALELLRERGWRIPETAVRRGLETAVWPGRMEPAGRRPCILIDGGHNRQGAEAIAATLRDYFPGSRCRFLLGVLGDKDVHGILQALVPLAEEIAAVTPDSPRALPAQALCRRLREDFQFLNATAWPGPEAALSHLRSCAAEEDVICVCGSLYMIGRVRALLGLP